MACTWQAQAQDATPEEARAIAKEAYVYGEPMVDNYRIQHAYFVDTKNPEYKAPWNTLVGAVAGVVGIEVGVVSGVFNLESSGV